MALQIITTVVLARLLAPSDYGLQSMVLSLTAVFSLFKDAGLSAASIQRDDLTQQQISNLFWLNLGFGVCLAIVVAAAAPFLAAFYREPRLLWITVASASIFIFNSLTVQHNALLNRAMRFSTSVRIDIVSGIVGTLVAIGMAALGFGYWSLICQNICLALVTCVATLIAVPWLPRLPDPSSDVRPLMRFGGTVSLNGFVVYIAYNAEKILLGRVWGASALGIYGRAYQLANLPVQQFLASIGGVAFPVLSRMQKEPELLRRSYLRFHSVVVSLTIPVVFTCALFADEIVRVVLGAKWSATAPVLRLLAPTIFVFAVLNPLSWLLKSTGLVRRSLNIALFIAPIVIVGISFGLRYGPPGVAIGYSAAMLVLMAPLVAWAKHGTGVSTSDYLNCIKKPVFAGAVTSVIGWLVHLTLRASFASLYLVAVELTVCGAVYAGLLLFVLGEKDFYIDVVRQLFRRRSPLPAEAESGTPA
jgi:O-antigen/teichoic acid export membrane protein